MMSGTTSATGGKPKAAMEVNTKGVPVNWNGEHWDFYKALMMSLFEEDGLENIATGKAKPPDPSTPESDKNEWKQNQTLEEIFEAPKNQTLFVHQQRQLVHQLRNTRAKREDDMNLHLGKLYDIRDRLATMKYNVHDLDMVDAMLKSLPRHIKYQCLTEMVTLTPGSTYSVDDVRDLSLVAASQLKEESYEISGGRMENSGNRASGGDAKAGKAGKQKQKHKPKQQHQQQSDSSESNLKCFQCKEKGHIKSTQCKAQKEQEDPGKEMFLDVVGKSEQVVEVAEYNPRHGALTTIFLEEALYVPDANWNLYSVGLAMKQGFDEQKNSRTGVCKV
ncbi:Hypothetical protein PHPALM_21015 [Phytophthora palmivora]|uniref:Multidrug resistance protein ABC Superfamily n=1 Tax=Phytophthora palmivora TaxID=4796 RepID=A0A2P4XDE7_9STRA|nr:Hypothetical protein PHPALM_21015 [Phytophthora palmivora]